MNDELTDPLLVLQSSTSSIDDRISSLRSIHAIILGRSTIDPVSRRKINELVLKNVLLIISSEDRSTDIRKRQLIRTECFVILSQLLSSSSLFGSTSLNLNEILPIETKPTQPLGINSTRPKQVKISSFEDDFVSDHKDMRLEPSVLMSKTTPNFSNLILKKLPRTPKRLVSIKSRSSVFLGDQSRQDSIVPGVSSTDWQNQDRKLGFQVARMWYPGSEAHINHNLLPEVRTPLQKEFRPDSIVEEYLQMRATLSYVGDLVSPFRETDEQMKLEKFYQSLRNLKKIDETDHLPVPDSSAPLSRLASRLQGSTDSSTFLTAANAVDVWSPLLGIHIPKSKQATKSVAFLPNSQPSFSPDQFELQSIEKNIVFTKGILRRLLKNELKSAKEGSRNLQESLESLAIRTERELNKRLSQEETSQSLVDLRERTQNQIHQTLEKQKQHILASQHTLRTLLHEEIRLQHASLPNRYLLVVDGKKTNLRTKLMNAVVIFCRIKRNNLLSLAFGTWKILLVAAESVARRPKYARAAAVHLMVNWIQSIKFKRLKVWTTRWKKIITKLIFTERSRRVVPIQTVYRRWRDQRRFMDMYLTKPYNGPLSDISLAPFRPKVKFYFSKVVRDGKRVLWLSATSIQTQYRRLVCQRKYEYTTKKIVLLQSIFRMWPRYCKYKRLKATTIKVQSWVRRTIQRKKYIRLRLATIVVQKYVRRFQAINLKCRILDLRWRKEEVKLAAVIAIQCRWREILARRISNHKRRYLIARENAALKLQSIWYKTKDTFHTFVLMSSYRACQLEDTRLERLSVSMGQSAAARCIQRHYRLRYFKRYLSAIVKVQNWYRGRMGYNLVDILRKKKWASRKLHHWARGMLKRKNARARMIQNWWWSLKRGRRLLHLRWRAGILDREQMFIFHELRYSAATKIQAFVLGVWCRRWVVRHQAALKIQKPLRFFLARKRWKREKRERAIRGLRLYLEPIFRKAVQDRTRYLVRHHHSLLSKAQALMRGALVRIAFSRAKKYALRYARSILIIQRFWTKSGAIAEGVDKVMALRRLQKNPFRFSTSYHEILNSLRQHNLKYFSVIDPRVGLKVSTFLYRLGYGELQGMFSRQKFVFVTDLMNITMDKLMSLYKTWKEKKLNKGDPKMSKKDTSEKGKSILSTSNKAPKAAFQHILSLLAPRLTPQRPADIEILKDLSPVQEVMSPLDCFQFLRDSFFQSFGKGLVARANNVSKQLVESAWAKYNNFKYVGEVLTLGQIKKSFQSTTDSSSIKPLIDDLKRRSSTQSMDENNWDKERVSLASTHLQYAVDILRTLPSSKMVSDLLNKSIAKVISFKRRFKFLKSRLGGSESSSYSSSNKLTSSNVLDEIDISVSLPAALNSSKCLSIDESVNLPFLGSGDNLEMEMNISICKLYSNALDKIYFLNRAICMLQSSWKNKAVSRVIRNAKKREFDQLMKSSYLKERTVNHVQVVWQRFRRKETNERRTIQILESVKQQKAETIILLQYILRFGWEEVSERQSESYLPYWVDTLSRYPITFEKPIYEFQDYLSASCIQRAFRRHLIRKRERERIREAQRMKELGEIQERARLDFILSQKFIKVNIHHSLFDLSNQSKTRLALEVTQTQEALDKGITESVHDIRTVLANELESQLPWRLRFDLRPKLFSGLWALLASTEKTSFEVVVVFRIRSEQKTCDVRSVKGTKYRNIDVNRVCLMNLNVGTPVEARYKGQTLLYRGKIASVHESRDLNYLYDVIYDDGERENGLTRDLIRPTKEAVLKFLNDRKSELRIIEKHSQRSAHFKRLQSDRANRIQSSVLNLGRSFQSIWGRLTYLPSSSDSETSTTESKLEESSLVSTTSSESEGSGSFILPMIDLSRRLQTLTQRVEIKIQYIRRCLRYGWKMKKVLGHVSYFNIFTREISLSRPSYSFAQERAASKIQSRLRGRKARQNFRKLVLRESPEFVLRLAVARGKRLGYIGFQFEGLNAFQMFRRAGLWEIAELIEKHYKLKGMSLSSLKWELFTDSILSPEGSDKLGVIQSHNKRALREFQVWWQKTPVQEKTSALSLINYYSDPFDPRSIQNCILDSEDRICKMFVQTFQSGVNRTQRACKLIVESLYPHTTLQIESYLKKYADNPEQGREFVNELIDKPTTHTWKEEKAVYELFYREARKIKIILGNLKMKSLRDRISEVLTQSESIIESVPKGTDRPKCSGPEAKAALLLRVHVFEFLSRVISMIKLIQKRVRGFVKRHVWSKFMRTRTQGRLILQRVARGFLSRRRIRILYQQQASIWEQLWDANRNVIYYFNKSTGESQYLEPKVPYRPLVRDRLSSALVQAWPHLDTYNSSLVTIAAPPPPATIIVPTCSLCNIRRSVRYCFDCNPQSLSLQSQPPVSYCFPCFTKQHSDQIENSHRFEEIEESPELILRCCICSEPATRKCMGILDDSLIDKLCVELQRSPPERWPQIILSANVAGERKLTMLLDQIRSLSPDLSESLSPSQLQQVRTMLERTRAECDDCYCAFCYKDVHSGGRRSLHRWIGFAENALICSICTKSPAEIDCLDCDCGFCEACNKVFHSMGRKKKHRRRKHTEQLSQNQIYCQLCERRRASERCKNQGCQFQGCDSCLECLHRSICTYNLSNSLSHPSEFPCVACQNPADQKCVQCGDYYCSRTWMGNPGCFIQFHSKGSRSKHSTVSISAAQNLEKLRSLESNTKYRGSMLLK